MLSIASRYSIFHEQIIMNQHANIVVGNYFWSNLYIKLSYGEILTESNVEFCSFDNINNSTEVYTK